MPSVKGYDLDKSLLEHHVYNRLSDPLQLGCCCCCSNSLLVLQSCIAGASRALRKGLLVRLVGLLLCTWHGSQLLKAMRSYTNKQKMRMIRSTPCHLDSIKAHTDSNATSPPWFILCLSALLALLCLCYNLRTWPRDTMNLEEEKIHRLWDEHL